MRKNLSKFDFLKNLTLQKVKDLFKKNCDAAIEEWITGFENQNSDDEPEILVDFFFWYLEKLY